MPVRRQVLERFEDLYMPEPNSGCWLWLGAVDRGGYGKFKHGGRVILPHRFSYNQFVGQIPRELEIEHICQQPCCVNPEHLRAVTHLENMARADCSTNNWNRKKTHCKRGHPFEGDNLILQRQPCGRIKRVCRICKRTKDRRRRLRAKLEAA